MPSFYSHGKLLLTAEYAILKGAKGLAIPCKKGQHLKFQSDKSLKLSWKSYDCQNSLWFNALFKLPEIKIIEASELSIAKRLQTILRFAKNENSMFLGEGGEVQTRLEFDLQWGLGSSSTLISNVGLWAQINPYILGENSFGGSGYDIACAIAKGPVFYTRNEKKRQIESIDFSPPFSDQLYFVSLNQKKDSQEAVQNFNLNSITLFHIKAINKITNQIAISKSLQEFENLIEQHEILIGKLIKQNPVKTDLFPDFPRGIKSLGAWGGDFILATGDLSSMDYFNEKGFSTIIPFREMCL